jgi:hypothetical protein
VVLKTELPHLAASPSFNLPSGHKEQNTAHKPVTWCDNFRAPAYNEWPIRTRKVEKKTKKNLSPHKISDQKHSTLPHKSQNTKHQYEDWTTKE